MRYVRNIFLNYHKVRQLLVYPHLYLVMLILLENLHIYHLSDNFPAHFGWGERVKMAEHPVQLPSTRTVSGGGSAADVKMAAFPGCNSYLWLFGGLVWFGYTNRFRNLR